MSSSPRKGSPRRRLGLSLAETLIALSISATLLAAVGTGLVAATSASNQVDQFFRSQQSARNALNRIAGEIRKCQSLVVGARQLVITTATSQTFTYTIDPTARQLTLSVPQPAPNPPLTTILANDVDSTSSFATDSTSVSISISVTVGRNTVTLNGSALPRRSMQFR